MADRSEMMRKGSKLSAVTSALGSAVRKRGKALRAKYDTRAQSNQTRRAEKILKKLQDQFKDQRSAIEKERHRRMERFHKHEDNGAENTLTAQIDHMSDLVFEITNSWWFEAIILVVIVSAFVCSGLDTYPELRGSPVLEVFESLIWIVFLIEFIMRVLMEGRKPWRYFVGPTWRTNWFGE